MTSLPIRVIVADDHPIVLEGIQSLLQAAADIEIAASARSFAEVVQLLEEHEVAVLVLDLNGMGGTPISMVQRLRRERPTIEIVVFSSSVDLVPELLKLGVRGYVTKESMSADLVVAIRAVAQQQTFLSTAARDYITRSQTLQQKRNLTSQELAVLRLLADNLSTSEMAEQLGIDPRTIYNYIMSSRRKIGVHERTKLAQWYRDHYKNDKH